MENRREWIAKSWKAITASGLLEADDTAIIYYSLDRLRDRLDKLRTIFGAHHHALHTVAIKTNPQKDTLRYIVDAGFGLEAASFEEVRLAVEAGAAFDRITYNSPVKTKREIAYCEANYPGLRLNANSLEELSRLPENTSLHVGLRINPLVHAGSRELYNVSGAESKFGVPIDQQTAIVDHAIRYAVDTLHLHVGSQIGDIEKVVEAIAAVVELAELINRQRAAQGGDRPIKTINIGGGMPAGTDPEASLDIMQRYADLIDRNVPGFGANRYGLITEFGQWIHKHNGIVYSRVEYVKKLAQKSIAYVHVGADLFMREAYTGMHSLEFVCLTEQGEELKTDKGIFDVAGPLCFNGDYLGKDLTLPTVGEGDIIAIPSAGANTYGLWSRHCSRAVPAILTEVVGTDRMVKIDDRAYFSKDRT